MNTKEVHKLNDEEIKVETLRLRRRLFDLRSQAVTEKIEDTSQSGKARKDLARVLTEANRRRREKSPVAAGGGGRSKKRSAMATAARSATTAGAAAAKTATIAPAKKKA